jgi:hypothetical protein
VLAPGERQRAPGPDHNCNLNQGHGKQDAYLCVSAAHEAPNQAPNQEPNHAPSQRNHDLATRNDNLNQPRNPGAGLS